jgi:LmbE family N-acetylglucosaminyl deacetylase
LLKTDVLGVFAHPDDETGLAPLIADLTHRQHRSVAHAYCTRGEGGGNMVGTQYGPSLGLLREAELRACLEQLGVRAAYFLEREDFAYTESLRVTMEKWGHAESLGRLVRLIRLLRPEIVMTMNPAPTPGQHGNHQAAGWLATEAFDAAADPRQFPEQLTHEGLTPWQPRKLYFGGNSPYLAVLATTNPLPNGTLPARLAGQALAQHRSQGFGNLGDSPWFLRPQQLQLVKSVVPFVSQETDLFRGLPLPGDPAVPPRQLPPEDAREAESTTQAELLRFVSRPAVESYRTFVRTQGIGHAAARFTPDLPLVAGTVNAVLLEVRAGNPAAARSKLRFQWPAGWLAAGPLTEQPPHRLVAWIRVPADALGDFEVHADLPLSSGETISTAARLHVVPHLTVARVHSSPRLVPEVPWPQSGAEFAISHTNLWEGRARDDLDSSAIVRILPTDETLFVEVQVTDDHVVSNIDSKDIKGHWRSDSVELCFDPHPGSEHTLGCFKLGVFPFDSLGRVRAARDADARPGPVEQTAPNTRLVSWHRPDGYVIRAAIPYREIGFRPRSGAELGFNVLIYDGDKTNALPGENINKSRLAWAPRAGVQGRPEDWGRLTLK